MEREVAQARVRQPSLAFGSFFIVIIADSDFNSSIVVRDSRNRPPTAIATDTASRLAKRLARRQRARRVHCISPVRLPSTLVLRIAGHSTSDCTLEQIANLSPPSTGAHRVSLARHAKSGQRTGQP